MSSSPSPTIIDRARQAADLLARVVRDHSPAVLASSFGAEDMVLVDLVATAKLPIRVVTLDTGRLPQETHDLIDRARAQYGLAIAVFAPDGDGVEAYVREHGTNAFFESLALRQQCCAIRKTEPLHRALAGARAWVTGLRRAQAVTRAEIATEEFDTAHGIRKFNPLARWSDDEVWSYLRSRRAVECVARPRISEHRLRAVHACGRTGRGRPRRPLVVGRCRAQGMRPAPSPGDPCRAAAQGSHGMSALLLCDPVRALASHAPVRNRIIDWLESEAIHILREVAGQCSNPALLFWGVKDSLALLRLA